jgi:hypothetical protein
MTHYSVLLGSGGGGQNASSYTTRSAGQSFNITVPTGYNAIHFQYAVGGGGGGCRGTDYDKAGGESSGPAGGSGGYISDVIYSVNEGASYSSSTGSGGSAGNQTANFGHPKTAGAGTTTSSSGLFSLTGGGGGRTFGGGVQGPLASGSGGSRGTFSQSGTRITSGFFFSNNDLITIGNVSELRGGPRGTFNQSGNGTAGSWNGNCGGDNCRIGGTTGASSYGGSVAGGSGGSSAGAGTAGGSGSRGSGGGGGAAQVNSGSTNGGVGGGGEMKYRFLYVFGS